jgi:3-oxoacyl-[acyl-carrier-protein] synthase II
VVVSEGAAVAVLESASSRENRGATHLGTLCGWAQSCDGGSVAHSSTGSMADNMRAAIKKANLSPEDIDYVNAHATSTSIGDQFEAQATFDVLGPVAVSSLKGHMGHSFAPCGTFEALATLYMLRVGRFLPTRNLEMPDSSLPSLQYLIDETKLDAEYALSNNFAMGGMNVSLVFRKT